MKLDDMSMHEMNIARARLLWVGTVIGLFIGGWLLQLGHLQLVKGNYYGKIAQGNRIRLVRSDAPRGMIYDRNGVLLAYDRSAFNLRLIREDSPDVEKTLHNLSALTNIPIKTWAEQLEGHQNQWDFIPITLAEDIPAAQAYKIETYQEDLPGLSVVTKPKRIYPEGRITSHLLGYVGLANKKQLSQGRYSRSDIYLGLTGIEQTKNEKLTGTDGGRQVEVDHLGRALRTLSTPILPQKGKNVYLSVNLDLQRFIDKEMEPYPKGVVIAAKPDTGEILALVSKPDFDPNQFVLGMDDQKWKELKQGNEPALFNKAVHGLYPPGSTFKMVLAMAGLDSGVIDKDTEVNCPGHYVLNGKKRYCWKRGGHGKVNVIQALAYSCNIFFYQLGLQLGTDRIMEYARKLGFGDRTGLEVAKEKSGLLPTPAWKKRRHKVRWYDGETLSVAIGQGFLTVTPIQLLRYVNTLANHGKVVPLTLFRKKARQLSQATEPFITSAKHHLAISEDTLTALKNGMELAALPGGTAVAAGGKQFAVAGKTGTSQVVGTRLSKLSAKELENIPENHIPHAIFVGYAPADNPRLALVVVLEHSARKINYAPRVARQIFQFYSRNIEHLKPVSNTKVKLAKLSSSKDLQP